VLHPHIGYNQLQFGIHIGFLLVGSSVVSAPLFKGYDKILVYARIFKHPDG